MRDLSDEVPIKRMSVARGNLTGLGDAHVDIGACEAAAKLAVKQAHLVVPDLHPISPNHVDVMVDAVDGGLSVTVTLQAHARGELDGHALTGVCVALLAARTQAGVDAKIEDVHLVQNVA